MVETSVEGRKHKIRFDQECNSCRGTGLYIGMAERDGAGVVCHTCEGKGWRETIITYLETDKQRNKTHKVQRVFKSNPGIVIGAGNRLSLSDFGGMPYDDWFAGRDFPNKSENRKFTCPAWWYQSADYKLKPNWEECNNNIGGSFSNCKYFSEKSKCWERWDKEISENMGKE